MSSVFGTDQLASDTLRLAVKSLAADATANSTTSIVVIPALTINTPPGNYVFNYYLRYHAAATTTGVKFNVDHSGTVTAFMANHRFANSVSTASDAIADQDTVNAAAFVTGSVSSVRAKNITTQPTLTTTDATSDMMWLIEGMFICTVQGDLKLGHASEVAASSTVKAGSSLVLFKTG